MTIQVKLFFNKVTDTFEGSGNAVQRMEKNMNDFLSDIRDDFVKDIAIVLGNNERMGLFVYKDLVVGQEIYENEINIEDFEYDFRSENAKGDKK